MQSKMVGVNLMSFSGEEASVVALKYSSASWEPAQERILVLIGEAKPDIIFLLGMRPSETLIVLTHDAAGPGPPRVAPRGALSVHGIAHVRRLLAVAPVPAVQSEVAQLAYCGTRGGLVVQILK